MKNNNTVKNPVTKPTEVNWKKNERYDTKLAKINLIYVFQSEIDFF